MLVDGAVGEGSLRDDEVTGIAGNDQRFKFKLTSGSAATSTSRRASGLSTVDSGCAGSPV